MGDCGYVDGFRIRMDDGRNTKCTFTLMENATCIDVFDN